MQFSFTDEQAQIRDSVQAACDALGEREALFKAIEQDGGFHEEAWRTLCVEMGLGLTAISEAKGGLGLGMVELASVMEKMGRVLLPTPFFTSIVLSANALARGDKSPEFSRVLQEVGCGEKIASFASLDINGVNSAEAHVASFDDAGRLNGRVGFAEFGHVADYFVVQANDALGRPALLVVDSNSDGVQISPRLSLDMTRPVSEVTFTDVQVVAGKPLTANSDVIDAVLDIGRIALASEQLGASEAVLEKTRDFVLERKQFGRQIGSFQAIKHRLADMMVLNEAAKSAAWYAACAADETPAERPIAAATAMVVTTRALKRNAKNMIQLHGGMGFTWEADAHLFLKRAEYSSRILGRETEHRETLAAFALDETHLGAAA